jgi:hypothetical protein
MRTTTGSAGTRLILIRGNSASGKSTVAAGIRERYGRGIAIVGQDNLRRTVLRERDIPGGANIGLIDQTSRYCLDHGFHTIVEGILYADHYADMLTALRHDHEGLTCCYYLHVPFEETLLLSGSTGVAVAGHGESAQLRSTELDFSDCNRCGASGSDGVASTTSLT